MVRRVLSVLLCGCLLATSLPVTGIAAEEQAVSAMEETVNDAGGGYNDSPAQIEEETGRSDITETETAERQETVQETNSAEGDPETTQVAGTDETQEQETASESKTVSPTEETKTDAIAEPSEEVQETQQMTETEAQTQEASSEPTQVQTESMTEETDMDETAVNQEDSEIVTASFKNVQEGGYYIVLELESSTSKSYYVYWGEKGTQEYERGYVSSTSNRVVLYGTKPNTTYELLLKESNNDDAKIYDTKEITTTDYKFDTSVSVENITANSADIKVNFTNYAGLYTNGSLESSFAYLYAGTKYEDISGSVKEIISTPGSIKPASEPKECTVTISLSDLKAGKEYSMPIWVAEGKQYNKDLRKNLENITFTTKESEIAEKLQFEAVPDETDKTKIKYTISLSESDALSDSFQYKLYYRVKGASANEYRQSQGTLMKGNNYTVQVTIQDLYEGTEYELKAVVDGVEKTVEVSTGQGSITPVITLSPLSFGAKMNAKLEFAETPEASDSYRVNVYAKENSGSWRELKCKPQTGSTLYNGIELTNENHYQGEWLVYDEHYMGAGASYEIKVKISKNNTTVGEKYFTLNTSAISLDIKTKDIGGSSAAMTVALKDTDEFFDWNTSGSVYAKAYYRVKGSESEWKSNDGTIYLYKSGSGDVELKKLAPNTEYEVKITSYSDENTIYGTTTFRTTEGTAQGVFSGMNVKFSGFHTNASGTYTPSDYAEQFEIYLVEKDNTGKVLAESKLGTSKNFYDSNSLLMETSKVQFKAVETLEEKDAEGKFVKKEYLSEEYTRLNIPNVTFSVSNAATGVSTFHADLAYTGDMCLGDSSQTIRAKLYYNTSDETEQKNISTYVYYYSNDKTKVKTLTFSGLTEKTTYNKVKLVVYVEGRSNNASNIYEQTFEMDDFTTKENATHPLEATFPDARLRELIVKGANLGSDATTVTTAQLEKITSLYANRRDFDTAAITNLTGIELLTELTSLNLENNEISDTPVVDWSKLKALSSLELTGNELTKIPDLSKNNSLNYVSLKENVIPAEEFEHVSEKLPEGVTLSSDTQSSQRIGGVQVIAEKTYYQRAGKSPLLIRVSGYKTELPYEFRYNVDGTALSFPNKVWSSNGDIQYNTDTKIAVGSHTLTVEMYQKEEKKFEKSLDFEMTEGGTYLEKTPYRFNARQDSYSIRAYGDKAVTAAYMQKGSSIIAMDLDTNYYKTNSEHRYKTLSNSSISLGESEVYQNNVGLDRIKNQSPDAGTYDLRVVYDDNTEEVLPDVLEIIDKAFVTDGSIGYSYDSTGDYFYLSISGSGFDASKMNYSFTYEGKQQAAEYVNKKETQNGYIVKFKKADTWIPKEGTSVSVKLTPKDGYDVVLDKDTFTATISQGIYYCAYNDVSNKIEAGVTSNLKRENVVFKLARYNSWDDANSEKNILETVEISPETVTETISYLVPMKEGAVYKLPVGYYRLDMTCNGYSDKEVFGIYGENTDYWSDSKYVGEGTGDKSFYFYSEIPFVNTDNAKDFQAEITGEKLTSPLQAKKVWTYGYNSDTFTTVGMTFDLSKCAQGNYTVTLKHQNEKLSSYAFTVLPVDKFVMTNDNDPYASWIDDSSFRVTFDTVNVAKSDAFTVALTDLFGNAVSGLKTEVLNRYVDSVALKVTGLKKSDAYKYYYIKVTHDTFGEAYKADLTTKYFADERGKYKQISDSKFTWTSNDDRMVGIGMYSDIVFPVTVKVYKPYDTELITSFTISKGDLESGTSNPAWYYFKQDLINALPDADALYDIAAVDSNGYTFIVSEQPIGIRGGSASTWTVSPTQLFLNLDSDETKIGTVTVAGNKGTPAFKSDNVKVATVAADKADKNKAVVTAVAEGTTNISITADKITKTVAVTVTKEPIKPTGISVTAPESASAGGKVEISASVTPAGAWTQQSSITWTSSDTSVISIPAGSTGLVLEADALKAGTAVITAALDGTEFTASCSITVVNEISDDEQDEIVKEMGTLYFLEGADSTLADIVLTEGWKWENPGEALKADNSHPVQSFMASYNKDDVSFDRYLDVYVSKLDTVRIVGKSTVNSGKEALYIADYTYVGANPANGYDVSWQWTLGQNLAAAADTGRRIAVTVSGDDTLSVKMTVTNTATGKTVSSDAALKITAGEIPDSEPQLENKKITIYKNSTQHVPIGLVAVNGNAVTAVKTDNADFKTEQDENGEWLIWLANGGNYDKKTNVTLGLSVTTEAGTDYAKTLGVTVDVTEITAKNVKFKQTLKPNAAYSSTDTVRAEFNVSSKYIIENITAVEGSGKFTVKSYNAASGTLVLLANASELDKDAKSYPAKAEVKVRNYGTWTIDINVAVQNKKPSLKLGDAVLLSGVNADASVALYNGKTETSCVDYTVTKTEGDGVTLTQDAGLIKVAYTGDKNGTYKAKIRKATWAPGVEMELKGKVSVLDPAKAKIGADVSKLTINISEGYGAPVTITAGIMGSSVPVELTAAPEKDKDMQAVTAEVLGGGKIRITPKNGAVKGSYKVAVNGTVSGKPIKGLSVKVTLTDKAPEVSLSAKGKINLANRDGTSVVYTPKLKNLPETLSVKSVRLDKTAKDSGFFRVKLSDDGKAVVTAVTGKAMNPKTKYKPVLIFILSNGKTVKTNEKFTISVTNKLPKVTVTTISSALCSANAGHRASYKLNAGNGYTISNVTSNDASCKVTFDGKTDTVYVSLSENANVTVGKKYTVPCTVYIKGADNTTKPLTVKLNAVIY